MKWLNRKIEKMFAVYIYIVNTWGSFKFFGMEKARSHAWPASFCLQDKFLPTGPNVHTRFFFFNLFTDDGYRLLKTFTVLTDYFYFWLFLMCVAYWMGTWHQLNQFSIKYLSTDTYKCESIQWMLSVIYHVKHVAADKLDKACFLKDDWGKYFSPVTP